MSAVMQEGRLIGLADVLSHCDPARVLRESKCDIRMSNCYDDEYKQDDWQSGCERMSEQLRDIAPSGVVQVRGYNIGWQKRSGTMEVGTTDGETVLLYMAPGSEWHMAIHFDLPMRAVVIRCSHHDAPTGEIYVLSDARERIRVRPPC